MIQSLKRANLRIVDNQLAIKTLIQSKKHTGFIVSDW